MKSFEADGFWWLPERPQEAVAGRLSYHPHTSSALQLIGTWNADEAQIRVSADPAKLTPDVLAEHERVLRDLHERIEATGGLDSLAVDRREDEALRIIPVVHGVVNGALISLFNLTKSWGPASSIPGVAASAYEFSVVVKGAHTGSYDEPQYDACEVSFSHLDGWCGTTLLDAPTSLSASLEDGTAVKLSVRESGESSLLHQHRSRSHCWRIERTAPCSLHELLQGYVRPLQDLLTTATGSPNALAEFVAFSSNHTWSGQQIPIEVGYADILPRLDKAPSLGHPDLLLLRLEDVNFETFIPSWYHAHEQYRVAVQFCYTNRYSEVEHSEMRLVSAATAAEAFHAAKYPSKRSPFLLNAKAVDVVLSHFSNGEHSLLRTRLEHLNEPSFRERLKDLLAYATRLVQDVVAKPSRWRGLAVDARNAVAHGSDQRPDGHVMRSLAEGLGFLVEMCLLLDAGADEERLLARLPKTARYQWLVRLRRLYLDEILAQTSSRGKRKSPATSASAQAADEGDTPLAGAAEGDNAR